MLTSNDDAVDARLDASTHAEDGLAEDVGPRHASASQSRHHVAQPCEGDLRVSLYFTQDAF